MTPKLDILFNFLKILGTNLKPFMFSLCLLPIVSLKLSSWGFFSILTTIYPTYGAMLSVAVALGFSFTLVYVFIKLYFLIFRLSCEISKDMKVKSFLKSYQAPNEKVHLKKYFKNKKLDTSIVFGSVGALDRLVSYGILSKSSGQTVRGGMSASYILCPKWSSYLTKKMHLLD